PPVAPAAPVVPAAAAPAAPAPASDAPGDTVVSPLVGTFYDAPSPQDSPYVRIGAEVRKGDTLCLIEAMKTYNQLEAEFAGTVRAIHKNSGDPVEYGEPLFVIERRDG
ncbi:MAG: acetyl-CoA carboxylase biotin carboxyl carrier protein, partial [Gammaproteobacteria bacterium]|nr:acetyl-CoA carboxylase biotin carboxyl carrier protein [Gammaproteobacteria bacterium]